MIAPTAILSLFFCTGNETESLDDGRRLMRLAGLLSSSRHKYATVIMRNRQNNPSPAIQRFLAISPGLSAYSETGEFQSESVLSHRCCNKRCTQDTANDSQLENVCADRDTSAYIILIDLHIDFKSEVDNIYVRFNVQLVQNAPKSEN